MTERERLEAEIQATRGELAETADALAAKLDVKAQARAKLHSAAADKRATLLALAGAVAVILAVRGVRRRRAG